jgi:hypothetical protein
VVQDQAEVINSALRLYERCIGQLINPSKCSMMFGSNCSYVNKEKVMEILKVDSTAVDEKYLGLPTPEGRMCKEKFRSTKERFVKRFTNCAEKFMSMGAKEVLIKSVAQAIPTYVMGVFKLSASMCEELTQLIRYFWWGEGGQRKVHWLAWDKLMMPKCMGGLGFCDMKLFNQALLARQAWRLIQYPDSLCAQLLKAKYYPNGEHGNLLSMAWSW